MSRLVMVIWLSGMLCACSHGPVRVHGADVSVDDTRIRVNDGEHRDGYGTFCPPGQAKKGRC